MSDKTRSNHLLSYPVIVLASGGDVDAINAVLKHYEGYIAALSAITSSVTMTLRPKTLKIYSLTKYLSSV